MAVSMKDSQETLEDFPCPNKIHLLPEDEISLDSIISALLSFVSPKDAEYKECAWDVTAKEVLNEKHAIIFEEQLFISKLKDTNCKLCEQTKIFLEHELQQIGEYQLNIEESYDGYVVFSKSKMLQDKGKCGHTRKGKYDNRFLMICEKRAEWHYTDGTKILQSLEARNKEDHLQAIRETKIGNMSIRKSQALINIKGREDIFILDGGIMLFMRFLIINNFIGDYRYYTMNLFGRILHCTLKIHKERKKIRVFNKTFSNAICVINTQYFNEMPQDVAETYYTANGKIIMHYWHRYNYLLHATARPVKKQEPIVPKLELMWKVDNSLRNKYQTQVKLKYEDAAKFLNEHPEVGDILHDYLYALLKFQPNKLFEFTTRYFQNARNKSST